MLGFPQSLSAWVRLGSIQQERGHTYQTKWRILAIQKDSKQKNLLTISTFKDVKSRSCAMEYRHNVCKLFEAKHGVKKRCQSYSLHFLTLCLASKSWQKQYLQSLAELLPLAVHLGNI